MFLLEAIPYLWQMAKDHATGLTMIALIGIAIWMGVLIIRKRKNLNWFYKH